ncbi:MAG: hypothetical protein ACE5FD_18910 [Anaerolineae bacterium]
MKMRQKLGAGLAVLVFSGGVSFMAQANVAASDGVSPLVGESAYQLQHSIGDGKLQVAARAGKRRRHARFSRRRGANRPATVYTNSTAVTKTRSGTTFSTNSSSNQ